MHSTSDGDWREDGHAFVLRTPGSGLTVADLKEYAEEELADYKRPVEFTVEEEVLLTFLGKTDRQELSEGDDLRTV